MRITILTAGSRGDVQPYLALGRGLQAAGYEVCLATHAEFRGLVHEAELEFALIELNPRAMLEEAGGQAWLNSGSNPFRFLRGLLDVLPPRLRGFLDQSWEVAQGSDALIYAPLALGGYHIAERLNIPGILAGLQPNRPTGAYPSSFFPKLPLGPTYNRFTHRFGDLLGNMFSGPLWEPVNQWRRERLGLPPISVQTFQRRHAAQVPVLYGFSPAVIPPPADWPGHVHVCGYWFLDEPAGWQPSPELETFLSAGPPPVYIGFGSMADRNAAQSTAIVLEALRRSGKRAVILTGWGGLQAHDLPDNVFAVDSIPHSWLLPQMAAVIHHGGAGTTAAGLRAGVPSMAVPFFGDQPFWGAQLAQLGVGPQPIMRRQLSVERLTAALHQLTENTEMRERAALLSRRIRSEDGVAAAVAAVARYLPVPTLVH